MLPILLVLSLASGTIWADSGGTLPLELTGSVWVGVLGSFWVLSWALSWALSRAFRQETRRHGWLLSLMLLVGLSFLLGFGRMHRNLVEGRSDREIAASGASHEIRLVEARVRSRRPGVWGDEVELEQVRAIDDRPRLPERLLLWLEGKPANAATELGSRADQLIWPGARLRLGLRVRPLHPARNPGTRDRDHVYARRRVGARARLVNPEWVLGISPASRSPRKPGVPLGARRASWQRHVEEHFETSGQEAGLVRALALGDRSGLSTELRKAFRSLGLSHLLAISGLHIGFIAGIAGWVCLRTTLFFVPGFRRISVFSWSLAFAGVAAGAYAWTTQAGVSVERASLLFGLYAVCRLTLRRIRPVDALAWVALVILLADPSSLFDLGAQLSFLACFALMGAGFWRSEVEITHAPAHLSRSEEFLSRVRDTVQSTLKASLAISIATAPLLAQAGLPLVPLAPVFNVVAIPWTGFVVLPTSLMAVATLDSAPLAIQRLLLLPASIMQDSALKIASLLPEPSAHGLFAMPFFVVFTAISFLAVRSHRWRWAMFFWALASLAGASPLSLNPLMSPRPRAIFFDVGQGDAALFQGREAVMLIDTGPGLPAGGGGTRLIRALRAAGVNRIDVLVLTHADLDHRGGLVRVLETIPVDELWLPDRNQREGTLESVAAIAEQLGTKVVWQSASPRESVVLTRGDLEIEVLWPIQDWVGAQASRNQASMVLRLGLGGLAFLLTADIGLDVERRLIESDALLKADVLKVAHHGSRKGSGAEFLARVSPSVAVLSAPCYASRGLPTQAVLSRLGRSGAAIWWTGRDGAVTMTSTSEAQADVSSWGDARACLPR